MGICPRLNCTALKSSQTLRNLPDLDPDPDVSGYGVIIGFTGTGYITFILLIIHYVLGFIPDSHASPIDRGILHWIWKRTARRPSLLWGHAMERCILLMSDQQMITGIAILASGYFQLCADDSTSGIISYDWGVLVYLGWFSSLTHLTTLTALRKYMIENPIIRILRLLFMLIIVVMLVIALIPTLQVGTFASVASYAGKVPAGCYFQSLGKPSYWFDINGVVSIVISLIVLLVGYVTKAIKLFPKQSNSVRWFFREAPGGWWKRRLDRFHRRRKQEDRKRGSRNMDSFRYKTELAMLIFVKVIFDMYHSVFWEILWLLFGVAWGTMQLMIIKLGVTTPSNNERKESEWGFGQFISTFLLALPFLSLIESCYETIGKLRQERSANETSTNRLGSTTSDMTAVHVPRSRAQQSSLPQALSFPSVSEGTSSPYHKTPTQNNTYELSLSPEHDPDLEPNSSNLSLVYPLHDLDFYQFPWFRYLIITLIVEIIQIGAMILSLFSASDFQIAYMLLGLGMWWVQVVSVIPACVIYNYTCLCLHEQQEARVKSGKSARRSPGGIALLLWKWALLLYIPVGSLVFFTTLPKGV